MTHSDRELLELAAKAAGMTLAPTDTPWGSADEGSWFYCERNDGGGMFSVSQFPSRWNPLTDDGDALRLAVKLGINIEHQKTMGGKLVGFNVWPIGRGDCTAVEDGNDSADLRRAIVRAAAKLGEAA